MPILNISIINAEHLSNAATLFDAMSVKALLPVYEIDKDTVRRELDERFGREVLGLPASLFAVGGPIETLRLKLAQEPSIRGNK